MTDTERMLTDDLRRDAELAPDPVAVLGTVRTRVRRRKQRRRTGIAAVAVIALAGVVLTVHGLTHGLAESPRPPADTASPAVDMRAVYTFRFAWLPDGMKVTVVSAGPRGQSVTYSDGNRLVLVRQVGWDWQPNLDLAGGQRVTVGGRPGRITSAPTSTWITFKGPSGRWINLQYLAAKPGDGGADALRVDALRIAAGLTEDGARALRLGFDATYLPAGVRLDAVWDPGGAGGYGQLTFSDGSGTPVKNTLHTDDGGGLVEEAERADARILSIHLHSGPLHKREILTQQVGQVNGHRAYLYSGMLVVPDYQPNVDLEIAGPEAPLGLSTEELLKIAQGVRWHG